MSIFSEVLSKINEIHKTIAKNFNDELKDTFELFDKLEEEYQNGRTAARERALKDKTLMTTLQSIHEDDDETTKATEQRTDNKDKATNKKNNENTSTENNNNGKRRASKKRSKDEVEGLSSPEQDKRQKRNASVKAQSIISKQEKEILKVLNENGVAFVSSSKAVNVNLTQKMRREDPTEKSRGRRRLEEDKENEPLPVIQMCTVKLEKISLPPEPMETEGLPLDVAVVKDEVAMPPPAIPVPRPRKGAQKEKSDDRSDAESGTGRRRNTRTKKLTDNDWMPPSVVAAAPSARSTRASSRASSRATKLAEHDEPPAPRPKRTRAKKKVSEPPAEEVEKESAQTSVKNGTGSPAEKPRPKRTRRGQKAAEEELEKPEQPSQVAQEPDTEPQLVSPKEERLSQPETLSPVLQKEIKPSKTKKLPKQDSDEKAINKKATKKAADEVDATQNVLDETRVIEKMNSTVILSNDMDKTMVLPTGVYSHAPVTPKSVCNANETVVLERCDRETLVLDKPHIIDSTVIIDKDPKKTNVTDDDSLLTDDSDRDHTPPGAAPAALPGSAVKEKVQQFEELAARTTRTKTRAMAKMEDQDNPDNHTPPDKMIKPGLSMETLAKMNSMIFNGKAPQISSSASKPRAIPPPKSHQSASTSKLSAIHRHKEAAEETLKREKEDARKKKEALLEAKIDQQKKKREDKMAAAAAVREALEKERRLQMEVAAKGKMEKKAHADQGKLDRLKEVERKKQEQARKAAETEERRRVEEHARQQRLADEQRRADAARRKQLEEAEAIKEAAIIAKEMEKRQREYIEKQKLKHRLDDKMHTPLKAPGTPGYYPMEPVYMADGFQHLNSDEDEEPVARPVPAWSSSKVRKMALIFQSEIAAAHVDALFSVRVHSPDLREIFPNIERARLKRTSSAVWRTPPRLPPLPPVRE